jgi:hypothetical protein
MARELDIVSVLVEGPAQGSVRIYLSFVIYCVITLLLDSAYKRMSVFWDETPLLLKEPQYLENSEKSVFIFLRVSMEIYLTFGIRMIKDLELFILVILSSIFRGGLFVQLIAKIWLWAQIPCEEITMYSRGLQ